MLIANHVFLMEPAKNVIQLILYLKECALNALMGVQLVHLIQIFVIREPANSDMFFIRIQKYHQNLIAYNALLGVWDVALQI